MNNPLEELLRKQKKANLQKKVGYVGPMVGEVPREFGEGEHFVQLAYITPDEAAILKELDLYGSNPPHTGPEIENIPNYNDFGEGSYNASGSQMSAAERGDVAGSGLSASDVADISGGYNAAAGGQETSASFMDNERAQQKALEDGTKEETTTTTPTVDVTTPVKEESFLDKIFGGLFKRKTEKENFVDKLEQNPKLASFVKTTYGIENINDLTDAQVSEINGLNNLSASEIKDFFGGLASNPLGTGYNALTGSTLGLQGIGSLGMMNALAAIAMNKPAYGMNPEHYGFTGPMRTDAMGNLVSDFSYSGPMSTNPSVNQQIANTQSIDGVSGLTGSQQAQAVANAVNNANTGGNLSFGGGGDGPVVENQQNTEQQTIQNYMDSLTESELYQYNQLLDRGYSNDYAQAYLGMM